MRCLVTGGAGFIGSHLVRELLQLGHSVRVLDDFSTGSQQNLHDLPVEVREASVCDSAQVHAAVQGMDWVFHLAALASVARSLRDPLRTHAVNVTGTLVLLDACRTAGVKRVVYAASSSAYGNRRALPKRETMTPVPASPYAAAKLSGESYCRAYWEAFGLETVCLRFFNVFGPRQNPKSEYAAVIPRFIQAALNRQPPVIYGDGRQSRDFTFVGNVTDATIRAASAEAVMGEVINVACGERRSLLDVIAKLEKFLGYPLMPVFQARRAGDVKHSQAAIDKAGKLLGYRPRTGFAAGLRETLDWYRAQRGWEAGPGKSSQDASRNQAAISEPQIG